MPIKTSKIGDNKGDNAVKRINDIKKNSFEDKVLQDTTSYSVKAKNDNPRREEQRQLENDKKSLVSYRSNESEERFPAQPRPESVMKNDEYHGGRLQTKELSEIKSSTTNKVLDFLENRTMFSQEFNATQNKKHDNESNVTNDTNKDICSNETMESRENCETLRDNASCSVFSDSVENGTEDENKDPIINKFSKGFIDFSTCNIVKSGRDMFLEQCSVVPCSVININESKERENSNDVCQTNDDILKDNVKGNETPLTEQAESNLKGVVVVTPENNYEEPFSDIHVFVSGVQDLIDELLQTPMEKKIKRFDPRIIEQMSSSVNEKNEKEILSELERDTTTQNSDIKNNTNEKSPKDGRKSPVGVTGALNEEAETDASLADTSSSCNRSQLTSKSNRNVIRTVSNFITKKKSRKKSKSLKSQRSSSDGRPKSGV